MFVEMHPYIGLIEAIKQRRIVAKSFGVDSCPMEGFVSTQIKEAFQIPEEVDICCLLALGYATEPFKAYGGRFPTNQVCFSETYGEPLEVNG